MMGRKFDISLIWGSIYHGKGGLIYYGLECHNSMGRGSMHHGYGGKITMGRGFDVP